MEFSLRKNANQPYLLLLFDGLMATPSQIAKLKFNYKLILGFVGVLAVFQGFIEFSGFDAHLTADLFVMGLEFTVFGIGAYLAYRYWGSCITAVHLSWDLPSWHHLRLGDFRLSGCCHWEDPGRSWHPEYFC